MGYRHVVCLLFLLIIAAVLADGLPNENKVHIVYLGSKPSSRVEAASTHQSMLERVLGSAEVAKGSLIHSYGRSFNGFVARLSDEEVERISDMEGVVSVFPSDDLKLHTTRSWDFMGFSRTSIGNGDASEGDVIVGMLDTGIWPESESFNDEGFGPPPVNWKGTCQSENNFTCNNKIIGARYYRLDGLYPPGDFKSPRDAEGHGSHTASTAVGREVSGASYYELAKGLARGGAPNARIAVYKVCWLEFFSCTSADILAAFDDAIADGVHIISISIGGGADIQYFQDPIAIGSFHAMMNGILTCNSAGNSGPWRATVANHSPWSFTIAANTIDRKFLSPVVLGNGQIFTGTTINAFELNGTSFPLIWGGDAPDYSAYSSPLVSSFCYPGYLDSTKVKGKLVLCEALSDGSGVLQAGGIGAIMPADDIYKDLQYAFPLAVTLLSQEDIAKVMEYIRYTEYPVATILGGEATKDVMAPVVASFSSRGPHPINADILKPDITAPGVDILAAWSPVSPASVSSGDTRRVKYNIISGTSMSCPHVSGAAAYLKSIHPSWSPAAIKSALMTTASPMDPNKNDDQEFAYGSGHLNPTKAEDPGLVFDASELDYISFLCKQGYNATAIGLITGINSSCDGIKPGRAWDLNYPSIALAIEDGQKIDGIFNRTVTNVGSPNSTYHASVSMPNSIEVIVEPPALSFASVGEKQSFIVKVNGIEISQELVISGSITWTDGTRVVRTPLVVYNALASMINFHIPGRELSVPASKSSLTPINLQ